MDKIEIKQLRNRLEVQRQELTQSLRQLDRETRALDIDGTQDAADQCVSSMSRESLFQQSSQRRTVLRKVEAALRRMDEGSFGECVNCGEEIAARRLHALPWTQCCLHCQEQIEQAGSGAAPVRSFAVPVAMGRRAE